jgi:hypothetical protein
LDDDISNLPRWRDILVLCKCRCTLTRATGSQLSSAHGILLCRGANLS